MNARLESLVEATHEALQHRRRQTPLAELEALAAEREEDDRPFAEALARPGTSLIAEHKRRSPSAGVISEGRSCADVVAAYERGGAAALSVLTEERHFGGSLDDLRAAREASRLPILRKDFTVDEYMLVEAKALGADAVLLVVGSLPRGGHLAELYATARALDLDAIVEVSEPEELEIALEADVDVIGINNRNLEDFTVDTQRTYELLADVPAGKIVVSESGISTREQIEELERVGVDAVLAGSAVMAADDPERAVRELVGPEE
ncbi:MAG TPA: indole-3-glycerol phosphate synthase TrpC [Thermoleophilaceae bacterium]|nr:indole-3-glycerol phosphate synthase TrpC [Thermoleophilaceae bacterium]